MLSALAFPLPFPARPWSPRTERVLRPRAQVSRHYAVGVPARGTRQLPQARGRMVVHCRGGTAWIVHDGELRDVVLRANESYEVNSTQPMTVHALYGDVSLDLQVTA